MTRGGRILLAAALAAAPGAALASADAARPVAVVATIAQIGEPLAAIAGGRAHVRTLMGPGTDPHLYRLTRSDVARLVRADLVLSNGLGLEARMTGLLERLGRGKPVVAVAETLGEAVVRSGRGDVRDPHVWMDPMLWARALDAGVRALERLDAGNAAFYRRGAEAYFRRMAAADARARRAVAAIPPARRTLVTAHDAFGYFGRAYGLEVLAIQGVSTESEAGIRRIEELVGVLVGRRIAAVFAETSASARSVAALVEGAAARGHRVRVGGLLYSDALGPGNSREGTYLGMFEHNVATIARALGAPARLASLDPRR